MKKKFSKRKSGQRTWYSQPSFEYGRLARVQLIRNLRWTRYASALLPCADCRLAYYLRTLYEAKETRLSNVSQPVRAADLILQVAITLRRRTFSRRYRIDCPQQNSRGSHSDSFVLPKRMVESLISFSPKTSRSGSRSGG